MIIVLNSFVFIFFHYAWNYTCNVSDTEWILHPSLGMSQEIGDTSSCHLTCWMFRVSGNYLSSFSIDNNTFTSFNRTSFSAYLKCIYNPTLVPILESYKT